MFIKQTKIILNHAKKILKKIIYKKISKTIFLAQRNDGLGERMRALLNAMVLAKLYETRFNFYWSKKVSVINSEYHSLETREILFSKKFIKKYHIDKEELDKQGIFDIEDLKNKKHNSMFCNVNQSINQFKKIFPKLDHEIFKKTFLDIDFTDNIKETINLAKNIKLPKNTIALHLRAGDLVYGGFKQTGHLLCKTIPYEFAKEIIKNSRNKEILLFSQDRDVEKLLHKKYKINIVSKLLPKNLSSTEQAFFEIIIMSRCKEIVAGSSGFSTFAATIGNINKTNIGKIYSKNERIKISLDFLKSNEVMEIPKLQVALSCRYILLFFYKELKETDILYIINLAIKMDPTNYFFIGYKILFFYTQDQPKIAENCAFEYFDNKNHRKKMFKFLSWTNRNKKQSIFNEHIKYIKKYADQKLPMASVLMAINNDKSITKSDKKKYSENYFANKTFECSFADEYLSKLKKTFDD